MKILTRGIAYLLAACSSVAAPTGARAKPDPRVTVAVSQQSSRRPALLTAERNHAGQRRAAAARSAGVQIDGPAPSFHAGLVVVDGVIYTNTGRETVAIDAATCAVALEIQLRAGRRARVTLRTAGWPSSTDACSAAPAMGA